MSLDNKLLDILDTCADLDSVHMISVPLVRLQGELFDCKTKVIRIRNSSLFGFNQPIDLLILQTPMTKEIIKPILKNYSKDEFPLGDAVFCKTQGKLKYTKNSYYGFNIDYLFEDYGKTWLPIKITLG